MMWDSEVRAIERMLLACPSDVIEVLEWGSGGSTVYFTQFLKKHGRKYRWTSLEYNKAWYEKIRDAVANDPNVELVYFEVGNNWVRQQKTNMDTYVDFPKTRDTRYDITLADGRKRRRCMLIAKDFLKPTGIALLHDAERHYYQCSWSAYPSGRLVTMRLWAGSLAPATATSKYFAKLQNGFKLAALRVVYALIHFYEATPLLRRIKRALV
ncbi:MAG: hypothetical protein RLZZ283_660 [Candidatus Parcubacteria bacterium]